MSQEIVSTSEMVSQNHTSANCLTNRPEASIGRMRRPKVLTSGSHLLLRAPLTRVRILDHVAYSSAVLCEVPASILCV